MSVTNLRTRSRAVRAALSVYYSLVVVKSRGFRVAFLKAETGEMSDFNNQSNPVPTSKGTKEPAEASFEIRISPSDEKEIEAICAITTQRNRSKVIRQALEDYLTVVEMKRARFEVVAISPSNDQLQIPITIPWKDDDDKSTQSPAEAVSHRKKRQANYVSLTLPRDLVEQVQKLAGEQNLPTRSLVAHMLRNQIQWFKKRKKKLKIGSEDASQGFPLDLFSSEEDDDHARMSIPARRGKDIGLFSPPIQPMLFPLPAASGPEWALVVAQDELGRPQQQIVKPDAIIPLSPEDTQGF
ncbi:MAG TPA: hypothetical protein PKY35_10055 [Candidatus Hydrogenedentes bacterium]|nr:hypothetical protein [Candidatus Hydrogenedentota bacterium]